jgi:hypothetical protein
MSTGCLDFQYFLVVESTNIMTLEGLLVYKIALNLKLLHNSITPNQKKMHMTEKTVKFEFEKRNKNSIRYKEVPEDGIPPVIGSIYVQTWFAVDSKNIEVTITKKD